MKIFALNITNTFKDKSLNQKTKSNLAMNSSMFLIILLQKHAGIFAGKQINETFLLIRD